MSSGLNGLAAMIALALWNQGWSVTEVAELFDVPRMTMYAAIRRAEKQGLGTKRCGAYHEPEITPPLWGELA